MGYAPILIIVIWGILSTLAIIDYLPQAKDLTPFKMIMFIFIFIIGGPVFGLNQILIALLEAILPDDGEDDSDDFNRKC